MIKIVVVEDEKLYQSQIKEILNKVIFNIDEEIDVDYHTKYDKKLEKTITDNSIRKIYIIDIQIEGMIDGIQIAKKIRNDDWESEIVFITSHDRMFETVYRNVYQVFDFIEKYNDMSKRLIRDLKIIFKKNFDNKMFTYGNRLFDLKIYYRSILYIYREKDERKLVIVTDSGNKYKISLSISEMLELLDDRFKQSHRSCIINTDRVEKYEWNEGLFVLDTKEQVYFLSKKFKKEVLGE